MVLLQLFFCFLLLLLLFFLYDECHRILAFRLFPEIPDLVTLICGCPNDSAFTTE